MADLTVEEAVEVEAVVEEEKEDKEDVGLSTTIKISKYTNSVHMGQEKDNKHTSMTMSRK